MEIRGNIGQMKKLASRLPKRPSNPIPKQAPKLRVRVVYCRDLKIPPKKEKEKHTTKIDTYIYIYVYIWSHISNMAAPQKHRACNRPGRPFCDKACNRIGGSCDTPSLRQAC